MTDAAPAAETIPHAVTAAHLTQVLRRADVLGRAAVAEFVVDSARSTIFSRITRLRVSYDGAADGAPRSLILKTGLPGRVAGRLVGGRQEAAFYIDVAAQMTTRLVPRCLDAHWDEATNEWYLLLEDLTDSHVNPTSWPLPPTLAQCQQIIDAWARFHAAWWGDARLGTSWVCCAMPLPGIA
jgi:hypothetical protein